MASLSAPKDTVREVKFAKDKKDKLKLYLDKEINECTGDREGLLKKCKAWVEQANSRRRRQGASIRDSNIDMPMTRQAMMQNSARLLNPIFQQDLLFVAKARNPQAEDMARSVESVVDYISDQIDYRTVCSDWVEQFQTFPVGFVKTPFVIETERVMSWKELRGDPEQGVGPLDDYNTRKLDGQKVTVRKLEDGTEKYFIEVDEEVPVRVGAFPEIVPFEDIFFPLSAVDIRTADWFAHRIWLTKPQIEEQIRRGVYNKKDGDQTILEVLGEPSDDREKLLQFHEKNSEKAETSKQYEVYEIYLKWDVDGKDDPVEIIVTYAKESNVLLRCVYNFYHAYKRPFVAHQYKHVQGSLLGVPLTFLLEPLHVAYSASFNQRLDAASKANETLTRVPIGSEITQLSGSDWRTQFVEMAAEKDEVFEIKLSQPFSQLPELEGILKDEANKLANLSDYSYGQEQIDRPTATGQIQIIEESKQPQYMMLESFRASLAEVAKHVLARYKQFYPEGLRYYKMQAQQEGMQMVEQFFKWPVGTIEKDVLIETKVSSANMSKNLRKQELVAMVDKIKDIYKEMMPLAADASNPMSPTAMISAKLLNGMWTVINDMLTEFEVGKKEALNPRLVEETQVAQQIQGAMQQMQQEIARLSNQNQQLSVANAALQGMPVPGQGMEGPSQPQPGVPRPMPMAGPPQGQGGQPPS